MLSLEVLISYSDRCNMESQSCLICISRMTKDGEIFFMCVSAIRNSSVEKFLFSSVHFLNWIIRVYFIDLCLIS